ncbi:MAG TPA: MMPL family transporter, partial [Ferruginibacter sp.]|nr:MMPL family transporter [Ferruginibacter sp.]
VGITRLNNNAYIVDDLPKSDKIYTDLKFFERNFKGVMPLEIVVDTKKTNGLFKAGLFEKVNKLSEFIASMPETNRPLSVSEGFKFIYQGISMVNWDKNVLPDPNVYVLPNESLISGFMSGLKSKMRKQDKKDNLSRMLLSFIDDSMRYTRISVSMADVGTKKLPALIDTIDTHIKQIFDTAYNVQITGTSITFQEGSKFIVNGLKESVLWAFLLIALCMLYLFRSARILLCSLIPNLIPLVITAGLMGWIGVPLKPSTVLIFSVALGIAIDITIRFLVNYKQELPEYNGNVTETVSATIKNTGLSIVYTSLVLIAGFVIFCGSGFGGTKALGWLTSVTLLVATMTNLVLLPVLLLLTQKKNRSETQKTVEEKI